MENTKIENKDHFGHENLNNIRQMPCDMTTESINMYGTKKRNPIHILRSYM